MPYVAGNELVPMDRDSDMWVRVVTFGEADLPSGRGQALRAVMSWPWFDYDGIDDISMGPRRGVHAGWHLEALDEKSYQLVTPEQAKARLEQWSNDFGWDSAGIQSPTALARLAEKVYGRFDSGDVYLLTPPAEVHRDNWCVLGDNSDIVDFLVLDRAANRVHWILATDD